MVELSQQLDCSPRTRPAARILPLAGIVFVATIARSWQLGDTWLWYDEVFGATFALQTFTESTVACARYDIHPPAWTWQLYLWAFGGSSDAYLLSNSVLWSLATVVLINRVVARHADEETALIAAALFAVMPISVAYARMLRMYSMLMFLLVVGWDANFRYLTSGSRRSWWAMMLSQLAIAYSHGTGILLNVYLGLFGILLLWQLERSQRTWMRRWFVWQAVLGVLSVGGLANAMVRHVTHTQAPDFLQVRQTLAGFLFGPDWNSAPTAGWVALATLTLVIAAGLVCRDSRRETIAWLIVPLTFTLVISYTLKPLWHLHALVPLAPFVPIVLAVAIRRGCQRLTAERLATPAAVTGCLCVAALGLVAWHHQHFEKETDYRWAAKRLKTELRSTDVAYVPQLPDFWGVARYTVGPMWGSPLEVQDLAPTQDRWGRIIARLSPQWRQRLHLEPKRDHVAFQGSRIYTGATTGQRMGDLGVDRILLVVSRQPEPPTLDGYRANKVETHDDIQLIHFLRRDLAADSERGNMPPPGGLGLTRR